MTQIKYKGFYKTWLYKCWKRFLTWIGDIMFATKPPLVRSKHIRELINTVQVGDVLCRKYSYYLDSYFIKGEYSHSGFCLSKDMMVHAVAEGVEEIDIIDFVKDCDGFIILRPEYKGEESLQKAIEFAKKQIGKPYDFLFDKKDKNHFYCHELTSHILDHIGVKIEHKENIIYADDLISKLKTVYVAE